MWLPSLRANFSTRHRKIYASTGYESKFPHEIKKFMRKIISIIWTLAFLFKLMFKLSVLCIGITSSYIHEYLNFPANYLNSLLTLQRQFIPCPRWRVLNKEGNRMNTNMKKNKSMFMLTLTIRIGLKLQYSLQKNKMRSCYFIILDLFLRHCSRHFHLKTVPWEGL
jgi:hypothetical protein